ncbi:hypothetical protein SAMN04487857_108122 [Pseudomonas sp. ok272]|uniref:hypothetical protein n=1 Tax=unclassified Pseudomonas TaxID=196821 RepID=UPI0008C677BA|nr:MULTISPECIES: hypothetical protein [unclassified Pseudomonas]SEN00497.1 hypothetical protein SAMN04487857_108122 [Pseudomonas sp. ok272]SFM88606.1 hypothetical protein SAMN04487858_108105 [Pseudomonas sp. ok602]
MSKAEELAVKLKQKQRTRADAEASDDTAIEHWPTQVYEMYNVLETWLEPLIEAGLSIRRVPTRVFESLPTGATFNYAIDKLQIEGNHKTLTLDPIARFIAGGTGRVDILGNGKERYIYRIENDHGEPQWQIQTSAGPGQPKPAPMRLDEDTFLAVIQDGLDL